MNKNNGLLPISIGITGHRDVDPNQIESCKASLEKLFKALANKFPTTPLQLISSLAEGADRLAAQVFLVVREELINLDHIAAQEWKLIACLPFAAEIYETDFLSTKQEFYDLLAKSSQKFCMPIRKEASTEAIAINGRDRDIQYQDASRFVASHSDILIAIWDGIENGLISGTADTVRLRVKGHKFDKFQKLSSLAVQSRHVVYHIQVKRASNSQGAQATFLENIYSDPKKLIKACDFLGHLELFNSSVLSELSEENFEKSQNYLSDHIKKHLSQFRKQFPFNSLIDYYSSADSLANKYQAVWSIWVKSLYGIGLISAILLPMAVENVLFPYSMMGYVLLMTFAVGIFVWLKRTALESKHLDCRALAELMRIQFFLAVSEFWRKPEITEPTKLARVTIIPATVSARLIGQHHFDLDWISERVRNLILIAETDQPLAPETAEKLVIGWVTDQNSYYNRKHREFKITAERFSFASSAMLLGGLLAAILAIFGSILNLLNEEVHHLVVILSAALPIMAVVVESYVDKLAFEPSIKVQSRMGQIYAEAERLIKIEGMSIEDKKSVISQLADEAINECISWLFLKKIKPVKLPT